MVHPFALPPSAAALITVLSPDGAFASVASGLARALGVDPRALIGRPLLSLVPMAERGPVQAVLRKVPAEEPVTFEARMAWGNAAPRWFSWEIVRGEAGTILATARDVDAERAAAQALALLEAIGDKLPLAIAVSDEEGRFRYLNRSYCDHYGYPREALVGRLFTAVIPEAQRERWTAWHRRVIEGATDPSREAPVLGRDGRMFHVLATADRIELPDGERFRMTTVTDVSERRRAQQNEQLLRSVLESAPMVIWAADARGELTVLEGRGLAERGAAREALLGRPVEELHGHPAIRDAIRRAYAGEEVSGRFELAGRVFDVCLVPMTAATGSFEPPQGVDAGAVDILVGVEWDVTEEVRAAEELQQKLDLIEAQRATIRRLSIPIVPVGEGIACVPLTGDIDLERAQTMMQDLLERIARDRIQHALVDLTGVEAVDTGTIGHLVKLAQAARLLGAKVTLTGLSPSVARTVVDLGLDLSGIDTRATLREALAPYQRMRQGSRATW